HAKEIVVVNESASPIPIDMKGIQESSKDIRADWRFLDLRDNKKQLIFKIQTTILNAMREFWAKFNFIELNSPKLVATPSEGGAELFCLDYFGKQAYLAQSPQVYKQMAIAAGFDRVYEIAAAYRADKSHTNRHVTEFVSVDVEMAWIDSVSDVMEHQENWLKYVLKTIQEKHHKEILESFDIDIVVPSNQFVRLTMTQAKQIVKESGYIVPETTKGDLDPQAERILGAYAKDKYKSDFVFVTEYPVSVRPFYHMYSDDSKYTYSFDLLYNGIEVSTGAQREHRFLKVAKQAVSKGVLPKDAISKNDEVDYSKLPIGMDNYFDCFKYGCPPHGGFGFGLSRFVMQILGLDNVKEAMFLSRTVDRITP
ncbi:MAG: aspartate--tRNA(Asn) ligase, partial [Firmicutes bacterium]|nr:aspartate--tRNA(Asn) ligase [Bacillota bacterium]